MPRLGAPLTLASPDAHAREERAAEMETGSPGANIERVVLLEKRAAESRTLGDRLSASVTRVTGSLPFLIGHALWFFLWITVNRGFVPAIEPFDPYPFSLLTLTVSLEAIFLASFVLMMQSRQSRDADRRAHLDLQVDLLAEQELTAILRMVHALAQKANVKVDIEHERIREMLKETDVQAVAADLERHLEEP